MRPPDTNRSTTATVARERLLARLVIDPTDPFARGWMGGVSKWLRQHPDWSVVVEDVAEDKTMGHGRRRSPPDGAISCLPMAALPRSWREGRSPVVFVAAGPDTVTEPSVATDDAASVRLAVDHLVDQGARHLGYVPSGSRCEDHRITVLRDRAGHHGAAAHVFDRQAARRRLVDWLAMLPKPLGIVCSSDSLGLRVLEAGRDAGIRVPEDVAVVGIGNDECLCDLAAPGLSSVAHNLVGIGYEAFRLLADLVAGRRSSRSLLLPPAGVVVRGSSDLLAIDDPVIQRALKAIRSLAAEGLTPESLAEKIGLPRRTLDRQFQRHLGRTVHEEVVRAKLARARALLAETDLKLLAVAVRSGFRDASQLCHAFKDAFGGSPMDYRRQVRPWESPRRPGSR